MPATVGLIANPAAGRDIRRLTARASVVPNHEKAAIVRRVLHGLAATGVDRVRYLADRAGIVAAAVDGAALPVAVEPLAYRARGSAADSTEAARLLAAGGVGALVVLGGDGTNRAVAATCGDVPLVAISTGTNNVLPTMVDGTVAGMAAGLVAGGAVDIDRVSRRVKRIEVQADGLGDFALIDAAACLDPFVGSRAIWDPSRVRALVLTRAAPWAIGLSAIGGQLRPLGPAEPAGLYVELGPGPEILAAIAPGMVVRVPVAAWRLVGLAEPLTLTSGTRTVALDGERELAVDGEVTASVSASGPRVVDIRATLEAAVRHG
ncbi:MAG TPA: NAD(+)/NADH kinase [Actinomycetes bacterium]|nr:NAD(+)/NADH kinase [Actinomycetes bacterium]